MTTINDILNRLPQKISAAIKTYKDAYTTYYTERDLARSGAYGYAYGLLDAGLIDADELNVIVAYVTE